MSSMNKTLIHEKKYLKRHHLRNTHFKSILNLTESPITINETIIVIINLRFHEKQVSTPTLTEKMLLKQFRRTVIARQLSVVDMPFSANLSRFDHPFCVSWILTITFLQEGSEVSQRNPLIMPIYGNPSSGAVPKIGLNQKFFKYGRIILRWNRNLMLISENLMTNTQK